LPRGLIVSVDPLRPAHEMENEDEDKNIDKARTGKALSTLRSPPPPSSVKRQDLSEKEILRLGVVEFIDRVATQYAEMYSHKFITAQLAPQIL